LQFKIESLKVQLLGSDIHLNDLLQGLTSLEELSKLIRHR